MTQRPRRSLVVGCVVVVIAAGACGADEEKLVSVEEAVLQKDQRTLVLTIDACNPRALNVTVTESATEVRARATAVDDTKDDCLSERRVSLDSPFGSRVLIDEASGEQRRVTVEP